MTTLDIVQRLRASANRPEGEDVSPSLLVDAADEIERLRLAKLPAWAQVALTSSSAVITVGNVPATGVVGG